MKSKNKLITMCVVCVLSVIGMILTLTFGGKKQKTPEFTPPPFEVSAQNGIPDVRDNSWTKIYQDGMSFTAYICGRVNVNDMCADLYFTNIAENTVWLKLRISDGKDNILSETGLIRPGEYVKSVRFIHVPSAGSDIKLKIMAYEADTYYSAGAVSLNTTLGF
ncbi:MAG: hypothetical protein Q4F95_01965 [Oscillospiraceae bacterium]|nr:hypothetical protein [Oscillospiraceae bacterium]